MKLATIKSFRTAFLFVSVIVLASANAFGVYQFFYKKPYLTYENLPFPVLKDKVKAGEMVPVVVRRCNNDDVPHTYTLARSLERVDAPVRKRYTLESQSVYIEPGCGETTSTGPALPREIEPGRYRLSGHAEIRMGLQNFQVEWYSETFEVIAP